MKLSKSGLLDDAQAWLDHLRANGRSPGTVKRYELAIGMAGSFWSMNDGPRSARNITLNDLQRWFSEIARRGYTPTSRDSILRPLLLFLRWLEAKGEIFADPSRSISLRSPPRRMIPVPSERDVARMIDSVAGSDPIDFRDRALLEVAYSTGARKSELVALDLDDLNLRDRLVRVQGKGAKERVLPLTRSAVGALRSYLGKGRPRLTCSLAEQALWLTGKAHGSRRLARSGMRVVFQHRGRAIGLRLSPHDFRRAFATHMLRRGLGVNELRLLLGHSGFHHIRHYVRYAIVDLKRAHGRSKLAR